ncbi:hypothetical protein U9M48_032592 [Paspalum notatum var. saurae]|uniref:DUF6598 domain-containing protein n=1 Tax=Paspalum notatum var. saurae TaxID=547442 RepID=A0AAQ3U9M8_PASNO
MQILPRSVILRVGRVGLDPPRFSQWWLHPMLARQDAPLMASAPARSNLDLDRLCRLAHLSGRSIYKPWSLIPFARCKTKCSNIENKRTKATKKRTKATKKLIEYDNTVDEENVIFECVLKNSSHRDGAIYKDNDVIKGCLFVGDIADRNETRLEPMMFSKATRCLPDPEHCSLHYPEDMIQFFSVRLSKSPISNGPTQVYGYIAARDERDGMLNYIVNYSRDDPFVVQQGSLIEMIGPKRGILLDSVVLIEFDMRIKSGRHEDDDLQLIDGAIPCSWYSGHPPSQPRIHRITGDSGTVDISLATIMSALEATIEVVILQVASGTNLSISSFVDILDVYYEGIQLFHGKIDQSQALRRFVVAVPWNTVMFLKFEVGTNVQSNQHGCATRRIKFQARQHGCASRHIRLKLATISVKVTWSTI